MIHLPEISTGKQIASYLQINVKTLRNLASSNLLKPGIYLGNDRYNLNKLKESIEQPPYRYTIGKRDRLYCRDLEI